MKIKGKEEDPWSAGTWEGARREQLRRWSRLSLEEILAAQEEMAELSEQLATVSRKDVQGTSK